jgi:hypothetical protein
MAYAERQLALGDLGSAERWMIERLEMLENKLGLLGAGFAFGCVWAAADVRSFSALVAMTFVIAVTSVTGSPPPKILTPGSLKGLHPKDARLCRVARSEYQGFTYVVRRAPLLIFSMCILGFVVVLG